MQVSPLQRSVKAVKVSFQRLESNPVLSESQKAAQLSRQFEALLVQQILIKAQQNTLTSTMEWPGVLGSICQGIITQIPAENISPPGTFGVPYALEC